MNNEWKHKIFRVQDRDFEQVALEVFRYQAVNNPVYRAFTEALHVNPDSVHSLKEIPFLPVRFFKSHEVKTTPFEPLLVFESSSTTGAVPSRHHIKDPGIYEASFISCFEKFYGPVNEWCIIGLLPSYLERSNSSLVYMANKLIQQSRHPKSGFYLDEFEKLSLTLANLEAANEKTMLLGVTFALLDFATLFPIQLRHTIILETGGMKGRREEMIRKEVHQVLQQAFGVSVVHSEYGMTELLSQAYSVGYGIFHCPPWMKILVREEEDPISIRQSGAGTINVIDLANLYSCSFIATDDAGKLYPDGSFEVLGRVDGSDIRGCSLMVV